jgi:hypothetical protein
MDVVFTYGRFNPPHLGHKMMIEEIIDRANKLKKIPVVIVSHSTGNKTNPLSVGDKTKILKRWFPDLTVLSSSKNLSLAKITENFNNKSVMILGENRKDAFKFLPFNRVALKRPNAAPSATKARAAAIGGNKEAFKNLTGYNLTNNIQKKILEASTVLKVRKPKTYKALSK